MSARGYSPGQATCTTCAPARRPRRLSGPVIRARCTPQTPEPSRTARTAARPAAPSTSSAGPDRESRHRPGSRSRTCRRPDARLAARLPSGRCRAASADRACAKMQGVTGQDGQYMVRPAAEPDLDAIAAFEVDIARVSFGDEAITDAAFHRRRVAAALGKPGEIALVAVAAGALDVPLGWAWMSARTNSLTGERYGNFRSLAAADRSAAASERKFPYRSPVSEFVLADIQAQPSGTSSAPAATATRAISPGLPSAAATLRR